MARSGLGAFAQNFVTLPANLCKAAIRHGAPTSDRARTQTVFGNLFLHIHSTRVHPHSLRMTTTWGLGVALISQFLILTITGILLMVYYKPAVDLAYDSIKDLHYVVPTGRFIRNIHRWAAQLMVACAILHMARVFYTAAYKAPREFNWLVGMALFVMTLGLSFTGYLLPWDQLAYWAVTIGANIAASPNELAYALGLPAAFNLGDVQKELLLGASGVGQEALTRFYLLHVMVLPLVMAGAIAVHVWRIRKDGGLARPEGTPTPAGKGVGTMAAAATAPEAMAPGKTYNLMCVVRGRSPHTGKDLDETIPSWPYLLRAELLVFMVNALLCVALAFFLDAPLKELANPAVPENPAKAPWYFLGLQEMVSYSAFVGGIVIPTIIVLGLALVPFLDREPEPAGVWFSRSAGATVRRSVLFAALAAIAAVAIPVRFGWLRTWFPAIPQLVIIVFNPGSLLTAAYAAWSLLVLKRSGSTRLGAVALFTCFLVGFVILTYVGTYLRGPNWGFYWSKASWPVH